MLAGAEKLLSAFYLSKKPSFNHSCAVIKA